jgi:hypothetical protein
MWGQIVLVGGFGTLSTYEFALRGPGKSRIPEKFAGLSYFRHRFEIFVPVKMLNVTARVKIPCYRPRGIMDENWGSHFEY